jgi:hypothetical protein
MDAVGKTIEDGRYRDMIARQRMAFNRKIAAAENEGDSQDAKKYKYHLRKLCRRKRSRLN